jgi:hypothetical protein
MASASGDETLFDDFLAQRDRVHSMRMVAV